MIAARLFSQSLKTACGNCIRPTQSKSFVTSVTTLSRSLPKGYTRRSTLNGTFQGLKRKIGPLEVGQMAVAGGSALGLGALCFYGLGLSNEPGAVERMFIWPQYVKNRLKDTYFYFGSSMGCVAAAAVGIFRTPTGQKFIEICSRRPILSTVSILVGVIATGQAMMSVPYSPGIGTKQMLWLLNCGVLGLAIVPVGIFGGAIALKAAWYTAGMVGGLSLIAMTAPNEKFLQWSGPLGLGLGAVVVASLGSAFFPSATTLGLSLYSVALYGGLLLFSGFLLYDTQKIVKKVETYPVSHLVAPYDPINASHHIVMDAINIFIRLVQIFALGGGRRK